jgi:hypothetical protein
VPGRSSATALTDRQTISQFCTCATSAARSASEFRCRLHMARARAFEVGSGPCLAVRCLLPGHHRRSLR